jgi:tetratricopeptide (TPR) repeat protein
MRGTTSKEAFELFRLGVRARALPLTLERWQASHAWFQQAIEKDTGLTFADARQAGVGFPRAWAWMAYGITMSYFEGWQPSTALDEALEYATRAVALDPYDYQNHWGAAFVHLVAGNVDQADSHKEEALYLAEEDLNMNLLNEMADVLVFLGSTDAAIALLQRARRVSDWNRWSLAWSYYFKARENPEYYDLALVELENTFWKPGAEQYEIDMQLLVAAVCWRKASLHEANHEPERAQEQRAKSAAALQQFLQARPNWTIANEHRRMPFATASASALAARDHWFDALRELGLGEDKT